MSTIPLASICGWIRSSHFLSKSSDTVDAPATAAAMLKAPQWAKQFSTRVEESQCRANQALWGRWSRNMPVENDSSRLAW